MYSLLAICNVASALYDILHRNEDEKSRLVLESLSEGQALIKRANELIRDNELGGLVILEDKDLKNTESRSKGGKERGKLLRSKNQLRNEEIIKRYNDLKKNHPQMTNSNIAAKLAKALRERYKDHSIGYEMIRKIIGNIDS